MKERIDKYLINLILYWRNLMKAFDSEVLSKEDYVETVIKALRRDFTVVEQNDILFSITKNLTVLREEDMRAIEKQYANLQESHRVLKDRVILLT